MENGKAIFVLPFSIGFFYHLLSLSVAAYCQLYFSVIKLSRFKKKRFYKDLPFWERGLKSRW